MFDLNLEDPDLVEINTFSTKMPI